MNHAWMKKIEREVGEKKDGKQLWLESNGEVEIPLT